MIHQKNNKDQDTDASAESVKQLTDLIGKKDRELEVLVSYIGKNVEFMSFLNTMYIQCKCNNIKLL